MEKPEYVIILAGVNDIYQGRGVEHVKSNLAAMYARAASAGILVVAATILPYNTMSKRQAEDIRELNRWVRKEAEDLDLLFCDTSAAASDPADQNKLRGSPDGLHPDVSGYRRMGERLANTIEERESESGT